jgi:CTP-dependent riboflavin kinase
VPDYPESKLEIISSERIRDVLPLKVGDVVPVEILLTGKAQRTPL